MKQVLLTTFRLEENIILNKVCDQLKMDKFNKEGRLRVDKFEEEERRLNFFTTKNWKKLFCKKDDDVIENDEDEAPNYLIIIFIQT